LPEGVELQPLGAHRLRDLAGAEELFQLTHPDLESGFPPLRSLSAFAHNLPIQASSFVGREKEMAQVKRLLGSTRLLTLTGAGGSGKTRLALQVAGELLDEFRDGVWFLELGPLADASLIPQTALAALGVRPDPQLPALNALVEALRPRQLLLVLDNCEHIVEAAARLADGLLQACPQLKLLATSREALRADGEAVWRVSTLALPERKASEWPPREALTQYEAVRLFIERAQAADPSFGVTNQNAPAVAEICHRLDGIPLAIELAAARVAVLSPGQIEARLGDRFRLLTRGARTASARQQTLRAAMDWSYDLLAAPEQALLCQLSVFAGSFALDAVQAVCPVEGVDSWGVLDLLDSLVGKSLVVPEAGDGRRRCRLLETVRAYAADHLGTGEPADAARRRHAGFYLALGTEAWPNNNGPDQVLWLDRLEEDNAEFRAALAWTEQRDPVMGLRLASKLLPFWEERGYCPEGRAWFTRLLEHIGDQEDASIAGALGNAGLLARMVSDLEGARVLLKRSLAMARRVGAELVAVRALNNLGTAAWQAGDLQEAHRYLEECLAFLRAAGDRASIAAVLHNLGLVAQTQGRYQEARAHYEESLAIGRDVDDRYNLPRNLVGLGNLAGLHGDYAVGRALLEEALALGRESGNRLVIAACLNSLGVLAEDQGDYTAARALYDETLALSEEVGDRSYTAYALHNLGNIAYAHADYGPARSLYEKALALQREINSRGGVAQALERLGLIALAEGDLSTAASQCAESLSLAREAGDRPGELQALKALGVVAMAHDGAAAKARFAECLALAQELEDKRAVGSLLHLAGSAAGQGGRPQRAARLLGAAEAVRLQVGTPLTPREAPGWQQEVSDLRCALGPEALDAAWAAGAALPLEDAVAEARDEFTSTEQTPTGAG
jgi:predicted ATPase